MVNVSFCSCEAEAVTLVRFSLWPATPTNPTFAFHQDLLLWLEALLLEACIGVAVPCIGLQSWKKSWKEGMQFSYTAFVAQLLFSSVPKGVPNYN